MRILIDPENWENNIVEITEKDTWNLDSILSLIIRDSLIEFRKHAEDATPILFDNNNAWLKTLDEMIVAFNLMQDDIANYTKHKEEIDLGLQNFARNVMYLWT